jgi:23S rRNA pseudouridine2605 synthase
MALIKGGERVFPVGRLDYSSEGLLLMTNDGDLANSLTRAAARIEKTYLVKVSGKPTDSAVNQLRHGVMIDRDTQIKPRLGKDGALPDKPIRRSDARVMTAPARIRLVRDVDNPWYEMVLIEGRNREIRKMFEEVGYHVEKIRRVGYGPLILDLEPGRHRELTLEEVEQLRRAAAGKTEKPARKMPRPGRSRPVRSTDRVKAPRSPHGKPRTPRGPRKPR